MNKILICLEVPSILQKYELYVPGFLTVKEGTELMVRAVKELSSGRYISSGEELLCSRQLDVRLDEHAHFSDYEIGEGDHLVLL